MGIGWVRGAALYVGALMGPGVLLIPALAVEAAGPASVLAWLVLLLLAVPLAATFAALGVRHPEPGGVTVYVRHGLGALPAAITGGWFVAAVAIGAPAVALVGGGYVATLTGGGDTAAVVAGVAIFAVVVAANAGGARLAAGGQLVLSATLVATIAIGVAVALPATSADAWRPFAPHGAGGVAVAASLLIWLFVGWEAMAQLAGDFRDPARDLPRAVVCAFAVVVVLDVGLATATVGVRAGAGSDVPLADLLATGLGEPGRLVTAVLAVVVTLGTMNVYVGAGARLAAAMAEAGELPAWLGVGAGPPRRPLLPLTLVGSGVFVALALGAANADTLVRATSACFVAVYLVALLAATRILAGPARAAALLALAPMAGVAACSALFMLVPLLAAAAMALGRRRRPVRAA